MDGLYNGVIGLIVKLGNLILSIFPKSPFRQFINNINVSNWRLGWLAWFFPVREAVAVIALWLAVLAMFYIVSVVARWVKIIGGD